MSSKFKDIQIQEFLPMSTILVAYINNRYFAVGCSIGRPSTVLYATNSRDAGGRRRGRVVQCGVQSGH